MKNPAERPKRTPGLWIRRLACLAVLVSGLVYLLPPAATSMIGQEELKAHAQAALASALERQVEIAGDVRLTMVPWLGLRTGPVTVSNLPGFGDGPFMTVDSVAIGVRLPALLSKRIEVDSISLSQARLRLEKNSLGQENWRSALAEGQTLPQAPGGWHAGALPSGLNIEGGTLSYTDGKTGLTLQVTDLDLKTSSARPFDFSIFCRFKAQPWGLSGELHAEGVGSYGVKGGFVFVHSSLAGGFVELPASSGRPGGRVLYSGKVMVHGEAGAFEVADLVLDGLGARISGQVNAAALYEETPYVHLDLRATAARDGDWLKLFHLPPPPKRTARGVKEAEFRQAAAPEGLEARLRFGATPSGWSVLEARLRDGGATVSGTASDIGGDVTFDVNASGLDLGRWLSIRYPALSPGGNRVKTLRGRLHGQNLRMGLVDLDEADVSTYGKGGEFRLYPFTVRTSQGLFTADIRAKSGDDTARFSGKAMVQALPPDVLENKPPVTMARVSLSGDVGERGPSGSLTLNVAPYSKDWTPSWLGGDARRTWEILGGGALSASFASPAGQPGTWSLEDVDVRTAYTHITGRADLSPEKTALDLKADALDYDRLSLVASVWDKGVGGFSPWPVGVKLAVGKLTAKGMEAGDLNLALSASPTELKFSQVSGAAFGGKFTGSMEMTDRKNERTLSASLAVAGMQAAKAIPKDPGLPVLTGALDGRLSLEASRTGEAPLWQAMTGQVEASLTRGSVLVGRSTQPGDAPWPVDKAQAFLRFATKKAPGQDQHPRETSLADLSGSLRLDSPGAVRSTRVELKGQAGLSASGEPLWYRQPKIEGFHVLDLTLLSKNRTAQAAWTGHLDADLEKGSFTLSGLEFSVAGITGKGLLAGQPGKDSTELSGTLDLPEFSPRAAAQHLGLEIPPGADPNMWRRARFAARMAGNTRAIRMENIQAALDDAIITGAATLAPAATKLDLQVSSLDLDRLDPAKQYPDPTKRPEEAVPLETLRTLSLDGRVRFGWLKKDRLVFQNALTEFTAKGGRFSLRQTSPDFYGGPYQLGITGDARGPEFTARMELKLTNFNAAALLTDLAGGTTLAGGKADFSVNVTARGNTDRMLRRKASGAAMFEVRGGRLGIKEATGRQPSPPVTLTGGREEAPQPKRPEPGLPFTSVGANFGIRDGLAVTRDFHLDGSAITAKGDGWVKLDDESIDLNLTARVPDVGDVPVRISGALYDPKMDIDKSKVISDTVINVFKGIIDVPGSIIMQLRRVF